MITNFIFSHPYWTLAVVALAVNIPLGYARETSQRFSLKWLFWIHASIPLIIYLRVTLGTSSFFIPITIFFAVMGQVLGSLYRRKGLTVREIEEYDRIPDLHIKKEREAQRCADSNVTIVLLNMGGPKTNNDVLDFQRCLFRDPFLIRLPLSKILQPLFAELMTKLRGKKAQRRYQLIGGGSPIYDSTKQQAAALQKELKKRGRNIDVGFSFNYSCPFPKETIQRIKRTGKRTILPLSLYPHYSSATTGSSLHYLKKAAQEIYPESTFLEAPPYYLHDAYIQAFVDRIHEAINPDQSLDDFYLVFSAHGLPLYLLSEGDPYPFQIAQTVSKILDKLGRTQDWVISWQSSVGPLEWLKPSTKSILQSLARREKKRIVIVPISFVTDHVETLHEIDIEYRALSEKLGIKDFRMSKALECHPYFINALADSVQASLSARRTKENAVL